MLYDVKVYSPEGKLKKTIKSKELMANIWRSEGLNTKTCEEMQKEIDLTQQKIEASKVQCNYCDQKFIPRHKTSICCGSKTCKQRYYREKKAAIQVEITCPLCNKKFMAIESRVYCNDPCVYNKK